MPGTKIGSRVSYNRIREIGRTRTKIHTDISVRALCRLDPFRWDDLPPVQSAAAQMQKREACKVTKCRLPPDDMAKRDLSTIWQASSSKSPGQ
ncbi:hypothetical protein AJ88_37285 [Mesorhizobium amorphae CCBAU 01583]|nr:hypothetical protein AJ88_37285 [Mesorhizobium amorphae CCBAU 01583]